jgi:hypothetical protein
MTISLAAVLNDLLMRLSKGPPRLWDDVEVVPPYDGFVPVAGRGLRKRVALELGLTS